MVDKIVKRISIKKTADLLKKSEHSVRQLLQRGMLIKHRDGRYVFADLDDVLTFYARKKKIPSWEENIDKLKKHVFVSVFFTASSLMVQSSYVLILIRQKKLEGYVTVSGDVMVRRDSINEYLRTLDNDTTKDM